ncbi:MAG TPA: tetratricopeptide repeat protein [Actinomycetota bacterium]|nr:tetratricopeptide repeat protein [Actinomycetota bacterium]
MAGSTVTAGTTTFLMTDIQGSTPMWERNPDRMSEALTRHDEIMEHAVSSHEGRVLRPRGEGDSIFAVFTGAPGAVAAALDAQRALSVEPWPEDCVIRVRMAVHTGEVEDRYGDFYGPVVNRCARLRAIAHGGQVVVSETSRQLAAGSLPPLTDFRDLGSHKLVGLSEPETVHQLCHPDLDEDFPPLASLNSYVNNLPLQLTTFVGREAEVTEVKRSLGSTRLLTLAGAGGLGKTRLALEVAGRVLARYAGGVWLAELAPATSADMVVRAVASAVGAAEQPGRSPMQALVDHVGTQPMLIVLDNCEHVVGAAAELAGTLLRSCPALTILATSREPLRVSGEQVWRVPPLSLPDKETLPTEFMSCEATRLFVDRAQLVCPSFEPASDRLSAVTRIVRQLDGMPLAIELAAAWVGILPVEEIERRLVDRFALLSRGSRTAEPRQQTLRAAIDWSHELLEPPERELLAGLSVFAGGFTLDAAEEVFGAGVLEDLTSLVDKSLVGIEERDGTNRYVLLESVREYAVGKLAERGAEVRLRHLEWCLTLVERASAELDGDEAALWLNRLEAEHDNIRQALRCSMESGRSESGLLLALGASTFWRIRGHWSESRQWIEQLLHLADPPAGVRGRALDVLGGLLLNTGDFDAAWERLHEAVSVRREAGDLLGAASSLSHLGDVAHTQGRFADARRSYEESLDLVRSAGNHEGLISALSRLGTMALAEENFTLARSLFTEALELQRESGNRQPMLATLHNLAMAANAQGDLATAESLFLECLEEARRLGNRRVVAASLTGLGGIRELQERYDESIQLHEQALEIERELGDRVGVAACIYALGEVTRQKGDLPAARGLLEESLQLWQELGAKQGIVAQLQALGEVERADGNHVRAQSLLSDGLEMSREIGYRSGIATCLEGLAAIAASTDPQAAVTMASEAAAVREAIGTKPPKDHELLVSQLKESLGSAFEAAWARAREEPGGAEREPSKPASTHIGG